MPIHSTLAAQTEDGPDEDARLISEAKSNPVAFQVLYDHWVIPVYQYFYYRCGDVASAEDLTAQLFLTIYEALPRYQHRGHFTAWLFAIARNLFNKDHRKNRRLVPLSAAREIASPDDLPAEAAHADEIQALRDLILTLPDEQQELIRLRYAAGLRFADIAILLNKSEAAVKKSLYRLQERLQGLMEHNHDQA
ncbi:MAG: sigma-70 family RNA polymerase sigma factor [Anaerolineaceae bacterium]|nr:sigma-70 family RNA polymerase sigma factor [Anaerolineaceae bacterium]